MLTRLVGLHQVQMCPAHSDEQHTHGGLYGLQQHRRPLRGYASLAASAGVLIAWKLLHTNLTALLLCV